MSTHKTWITNQPQNRLDTYIHTQQLRGEVGSDRIFDRLDPNVGALTRTMRYTCVSNGFAHGLHVRVCEFVPQEVQVSITFILYKSVNP